jgi:hypothetical protein
MFEKLKKKLRNIGRKQKAITESYDRVMEAATFAQAGEHEYAKTTMARQTEKESDEAKGRGKILVVGNEYSFSDRLMGYATDMAKRMERDIIALNAMESDVRFRLLAHYHQTVRDDFRLRAEESAEVFKEKALQQGIGFEHCVKFGNSDHAIEAICNNLGETTYVLLEPELENEEAAVNVGVAASYYDVPVFCVKSQTTH